MTQLSLLPDPADLQNGRSPWRSCLPTGPCRHVTLKFDIPVTLIEAGEAEASDYAERVAAYEARRYVADLMKPSGEPA